MGLNYPPSEMKIANYIVIKTIMISSQYIYIQVRLPTQQESNS